MQKLGYWNQILAKQPQPQIQWILPHFILSSNLLHLGQHILKYISLVKNIEPFKTDKVLSYLDRKFLEINCLWKYLLYALEMSVLISC